jgi:hypothetical protein
MEGIQRLEYSSNPGFGEELYHGRPGQSSPRQRLVANSNMARKLPRTSRRGPSEEGGSILLMCASLALIVLVTLWPFDCSVSDTLLRLGRPILLVGWGRSSVSDVLLNAGLFMPFGFGLASLLTWRRRLTGLKSLAVVFGVCFAVAYAIEVLQQFMPSRYPALRDALANSFGGVLGWSGFQSLVRWRSRRHHEDSRA